MSNLRNGYIGTTMNLRVHTLRIKHIKVNGIPVQEDQIKKSLMSYSPFGKGEQLASTTLFLCMVFGIDCHQDMPDVAYGLKL